MTRNKEALYNYFRDFDPRIGRYLKSDPVGLDAGINTYAYVSSNPLSMYDSDGLRQRGIDGREFPPAPGERRCSAGDAGCASGMPTPEPPPGRLDKSCFLLCTVFLKAGGSGVLSAGAEGGAAGSAGTVLEGTGAGARIIANNPITIGIGALYGLDYCWRKCRVVSGCLTYK